MVYWYLLVRMLYIKMARGTIICFLLLSLIYIRSRVNGAVKHI